MAMGFLPMAGPFYLSAFFSVGWLQEKTWFSAYQAAF
jgi:hypothetical protein